MPANKTYVLGLTGGIGCGKSETAKYLASLGAKHVDADGISRRLTTPGGAALPAIREAFGDGVFDADGALDRRKLGEIVFNDPMRRRQLEGILHPMIQRETMEAIRAAGEEGFAVTVLDVPLLFETGMDVLCDETWTLSLDPQIQLERIRARDGLDEAQAQARVASQMSMEARNARADRVIDTGRPLEKTRAELSQLFAQLKRRLG